MSTAYSYKPGPSSAGAYQISGRPYLTGGAIGAGNEVAVTFPSVTKAITIYNTHASNTLRVHFDTDDNANVLTNKHFIDIPAAGGSSNNPLSRLRLEVRCSKVYLSSASATTYQLAAELTLIPDTINLTGSGIND